MNRKPGRRAMTAAAIALTFGSGAMDVTSFTRLGNVFASVMTGNMVLFGLAAARRSPALALHTLMAVTGYVTGVGVGSRIAVGGADGDGHDGALPAHVSRALLTELGLLAVFAAGWEAAGARPAGWGQFCLLAIATAGMGVQSSLVRHMKLAEVSTTYLTGTLTGLVSSLVSRHGTSDGPRRFGVLIGLVTGASLCGLFIATAPAGAPVLPLAALVTTLVLTSGRPRLPQAR